MLLRRPRDPTITITFGFEISGGEMNRPKASSAMETQRATRKTPLISAPRISARCHPYEFSAEDGERASLIVYRATTRERTSLGLVRRERGFVPRKSHLSMWNESATRASEPTR